jgi:Holliday junction resolvase
MPAGSQKGRRLKDTVVYDRDAYQTKGKINMNKHYRAGLIFEYEVRNWLRARGWMIFRSAGSKSAVDLIGIRANQTILVQCKYGTKPALQERINMCKLEETTGASIQVLLAYRQKHSKEIEWYAMKKDGDMAKVNI